ncbi:hypothetical protein GIB67_001299 [Kingdonia uniflora]|uniref:Uncharacterized protein n=1 Tax=Kingdonia uniflora TaxID=39325 RepID=A0A7J7LL17_9MAGN|nr:hypothetical protein GIB67_001299 [Kingdonia uniflora]
MLGTRGKRYTPKNRSCDSIGAYEKNFVISDPRLPDNPIIFASDRFFELGNIAEKKFWEETAGKKFWNLFHLQPMCDQKGEL